MDAFFERLIVQTATIDELLSDDFEALCRGRKAMPIWLPGGWPRGASRRASGDWSLFARRLDRDGLSIGEVLAKFATVRRRASASVPAWIDDAIWIEAALQSPSKDDVVAAPEEAEPCAFEHLFAPVVEQAEALLWAGIDDRAANNLNDSARACLRHSLLKEYVQPCRSGNLRALCQGAEGQRNAGQCERDAARWRNVAIRSVRRRHEEWRVSPPVRRQAGAVAIDCLDHAAVDRYIARIRHAARFRSGGDPSRYPSLRCGQPCCQDRGRISPIRTMAATRS